MALDFFAGCLGGFAGILVGHPFDTIKVRLQTQATKRYTGTFNCFLQIIKQESVFGLYKGMASPMAGSVLINAIVFGVHGNVLRRLEPGLHSQFIAGSTAGVIQSVVCGPMELAKTRMQIQGQGEKMKHIFIQRAADRHIRENYSGSFNCLYKIYKAEGVRGCFRGYLLTLLRETPSFGAYFTTYAFLCQTLISPGETIDSLGMVPLLIAGGCSGIMSWLVTYPVDVLKTRFQADGVGPKPLYAGTWDCVVRSVEREGYGVLTRGLSPTLLRAFPTNAATLTVVTIFLRFMRSKEMEED